MGTNCNYLNIETHLNSADMSTIILCDCSNQENIKSQENNIVGGNPVFACSHWNWIDIVCFTENMCDKQQT